MAIMEDLDPTLNVGTDNTELQSPTEVRPWSMMENSPNP